VAISGALQQEAARRACNAWLQLRGRLNLYSRLGRWGWCIIMHKPTNLTNSTTSADPSCNWTAYQISAKSNILRLAFCNLNISNSGAFRHLGFGQKWIWISLLGLHGPICTDVPNLSKIGSVIYDSTNITNFTGFFSLCKSWVDWTRPTCTSHFAEDTGQA